jgi:multidrug resistance efflux pump
MARMSNLFQEGAVSRQQVDRARTDLDTAVAATAEAEAALRRAQEGTPREELEQARQSYRQAQAARALVEAGSRREEIAAARAETEAARQNLRLLERGTRAEDVQAARARLAQAQATLQELLAGSRREEVAQAQAAARAAAATARGAAENLRERVIFAPRDGVVERILIADGDLIQPGTSVLRIADPSDLWLRIYVPESQLARVSVGAEAELRVDGVDAPVVAVVESVATRGEFTPANLQTPEERGKQVFAVRLRLKRPDARIKAGMSATVTRVGAWTVSA